MNEGLVRNGRIQQLKPTIGLMPEGTEPKSEIRISGNTSVASKHNSLGADPSVCECALRKVGNFS